MVVSPNGLSPRSSVAEASAVLAATMVMSPEFSATLNVNVLAPAVGESIIHRVQCRGRSGGGIDRHIGIERVDAQNAFGEAGEVYRA